MGPVVLLEAPPLSLLSPNKWQAELAQLIQCRMVIVSPDATPVSSWAEVPHSEGGGLLIVSGIGSLLPDDADRWPIGDIRVLVQTKGSSETADLARLLEARQGGGLTGSELESRLREVFDSSEARLRNTWTPCPIHVLQVSGATTEWLLQVGIFIESVPRA